MIVREDFHLGEKIKKPPNLNDMSFKITFKIWKIRVMFEIAL